MTQHKIVHNPFKIVQMFEEEVAEYTGAPYAVAVDSCTNALFLCLQLHKGIPADINIPYNTYLSVAQSILNAEFGLTFREEKWQGEYRLDPLPIWDCAKRFTSDMYKEGQYMCLSFHIKKHLPIGKGGMILLDDKYAARILKRMRYEGRGEVNYRDDNVTIQGWNMYMTPEEAARGLTLMQNCPTHNRNQKEDPPYRDLREFDMFKGYKTL